MGSEEETRSIGKTKRIASCEQDVLRRMEEEGIKERKEINTKEGKKEEE